jgi:hypothetical protein
MLPNAGLLLASQIQSSGLSWVAPWTAMHCVDRNTSAADGLAVSFITVWLVFAFVNRIINICGEGQKISERSWVFEKLVHHLKLQPKEGWPTNLKVFTKAVKHPIKDKKHTRGRKYEQILFINIRLLIFFLTDIMNSLAWEIMWLSFAFIYGLTGTIVAWSNCYQPTNLGSCWGNVLQMGLGQMVPLVLLILPAFAFLESFSKC